MTTPFSPLLGALLLTGMTGVLITSWRNILAGVGETRGSVVCTMSLASMAVVDVVGGVGGGVVGGILPGLGLVVLVVGGAGVVIRRRPTSGPASLVPSWSVGEVAVAAALGGLMVWCALGSWMWDERSTHLPLAGAVARGVLPLEHPLFPGQALHYHPGYAVVVGVVRRLLGLPLDVCADLVTIVAVVLMLWTLRDLLRALAQACGLQGSLVSVVGVPLVWLGGGPLAAVLADGLGASLPGKGLLPSSWVNGATFPPLVVTNVLQHPQGLAMPITCALLTLLLGTRSTGRVAVAAVVVVLLCRVQILFCAFGGLILAVVVAGDMLRAPTARAGWLRVALVAVAGVTSLALGGLSTAAGDAITFGRGYFAADGMWVLVRAPLTFGVALLALPAALWLARRAPIDSRLVVTSLGLASALAILVGLVATYARSWDIVKFFGVGLFFGHIVLAVTCAALARHAQRPIALRAVLGVVLVASCWSGAFWLLRHGPLQGIVAPAAREQGPDPWAVAIDEACGAAVDGRSRVLSTRLSLGQVGWLVPGTPWRASRDTVALLIDRDLADGCTAARDRALKALGDDDRSAFNDAMAVLGTRMVVVDDAAERRFRRALGPERFTLLCRAPHGAVYERRRDP